MTTMRSIIKGSLRLINAVGTNEEPTSSDVDVCLQSMNGLLDSMSNDLLNIHTFSPYRFPLTAGQKEYTLGPATDADGNATNADWVIERPMRIEQAKVMLYSAVTPSSGTDNNVVTSTEMSTPDFVLHLTAPTMQYKAVYDAYYSTTTAIGGAVDSNTTNDVFLLTPTSGFFGTTPSSFLGTAVIDETPNPYWSFELVPNTSGMFVGLIGDTSEFDSTTPPAAAAYWKSGFVQSSGSGLTETETFEPGDVLGVSTDLYAGSGTYGTVVFWKNGVYVTSVTVEPKLAIKLIVGKL